MKSIVISSGHSEDVRGAEGPKPWGLDEVDEARKVVDQVADILRRQGVQVATFHDNTSDTQDENLKTIVNFHNSKTRELDVSVHFNAAFPEGTSDPVGTEVFYVSQYEMAKEISSAIANAGKLINRGPKKSNDLYFLNHTEQPAVLIEVCFVDSSEDCTLYRTHFQGICIAIADAINPGGTLIS